MKRLWTAEQAELFEFTQGQLKHRRVAVLADAGSGKTSTLVERAKEFLKNNISDQKKQRILCVSFTERSKSDLESRLFEYSEIEVYTIHGFCARIIQEFGSLIEFPPVFSIMSSEEERVLFYESFEKVFRRLPMPTNVHHSSVYFDFVKSFKESSSKNLEPVKIHSFDQELLFKFSSEVINEFEHSKLKRYQLEYSDLEKTAYQLLEINSVKNIIQNRFSHIFVDEFQDTSPIQSAIVRNCCGDKLPLFVVGDEKQSIYRFRGARVKVFKDFVSLIGNTRRLTTNFRSDASIVNAVNQVCEPFFENYQLMKSGLEPSVEKAIKSCVIRIESEELADGILDAIRRIEEMGGDRSQVVLLMKKLKNKDALFSTLEKRGLKTILDSVSNLGESDLQKLVNLWIYTCFPWKKIREAQVLVDFYSENEEQNIKNRLDSDQSLFDNEIPVHQADKCLHFLNQKFNLRNRFGITFDEFSIFIYSEQTKGKRPAEIANELEFLLKEEERIPDLIKFAPPPALKGAMRVMTVHGSKGLEFKYVILADLDTKSQSTRGFLESDGNLFLADRDEDDKLKKSAEYIRSEEIEKAETIEESQRLLYVAMTRAQQGLFLVTQCTFKKPKDNSWSSWVQNGIKNFVTAEKNIRLKVSKSERSFIQIEKYNLEKPVYSKARFGATELSATNHSLQTSSTTKPLVKYDQGNEIFSEIGKKVHAFLQFEDWVKLEKYAEKMHLPISAFMKWLLTDEGRRIFPDKHEAKIFKEFAFEAVFENKQIITGRIDRLVVFNQPNLEAVIIDFKILHSKREANLFISEYSEQMKIYTKAIKQLTGYSKVTAVLLDICNRTGKIHHQLNV